MRRGLRAVALVLVVAHAAPALAAPDKAACVAAHADAQSLRAKGKLRAAHEALLTCAANACPSLVKVDCTRWIPEVDAQQPTLIAKASDAEGHDLADVKLLVDGEVLQETLDGQQVEVDPGPHRLRWESPGHEPVENDIVVVEGEKARTIVVQFPVVEKVEGPLMPRPRGALPWVFGAASVVALGSFVAFGLAGKSELDDLKDSCAPKCDPTARDSVHTKFLVADISLGIAVVTGGIAAWLFLRKMPLEPQPATTSVGFAPVAGGGGVAVWGGAF
ncbi:MAG: hypothetical protein ABI175_11775 [Polyangiales bacterium]